MILLGQPVPARSGDPVKTLMGTAPYVPVTAWAREGEVTAPTHGCTRPGRVDRSH